MEKVFKTSSDSISIKMDNSLLLEKGKKRSRELGLKNMEFIQADAYHLDLKENDFDMILFHASLHHFQNIQGLIGGDLLKALKGEGILVINEYVGSGIPVAFTS